jgi:hypothetical protein
MKLTANSSRKFYLNGQLLTDVIGADVELGQIEMYEHTCSRLHPPERIPDGDNPTGYRTFIARGAVRVEETTPPPTPAQPDLGWGMADCYVCTVSGYIGCFCGQHIPFPS